ncbi:holo-ACP synthase, malonate decarboxylase-specific [Afipia carboxidovorans OM5]|uniref:Malonate holo-ACP synthase MdcG n=1 Tax=Afipia carboxidovorans (strain ATCC 49405 / DSM 1227 / KCTC 32145 / OM5) TaxID=504832 RepID=B6JE84_AFIC5|nr:malonate decarboxylase holo-[acyl-carrier-protein] synthase [Afipia carboxidovorans]ACI93977.1 holo-ACP synthase, malonate decarboxylase-specific [Afipia carboxidovorans OM5]AEI02353.1 malonate holo-ACP synthase MdcG [Afipia carboxidovorans OM4]AEI05929.1 malonate holo-ACP synthase MdcG [Afipia carboxidovorans OM5]
MTGHPGERHAFVYCAPERLSDGAIRTAHSQDIAVIESWIRAGRPLIARTRSDRDADGLIALGLPLPLNLGKKRIALTVEPSLVQSVAQPPSLREAIETLPPEWRAGVDRLCQELTEHAASVRVVGSLAWQYLTGEIYLHPRSDLDLVIHPTSMAQLRALLQILEDSDLSPGPRIDGEIVAPSGEAVAWRELLSSSRDVLVKDIRGPRIASRDMWLSPLEGRVP